MYQMTCSANSSVITSASQMSHMIDVKAAKDTDDPEKNMKQIEDMKEDVEDNKQSYVIVKCKMNEEKNESNETKEIVSTDNNEPLQTSNKENEDSPLSSNKLAKRIKCTSEISDNEIVKKSNNANAKNQCSPKWCYQN
ncbi:12251_t:CDS:2, partial [Racocetra persica]